jgi:hypothetical protein
MGSWAVVYLEIYRWHHMTPSFRLNPPAAPAGFPPPRAGLFLLCGRALGLAVPIAFLVFLLAATICGKSKRGRTGR